MSNSSKKEGIQGGSRVSSKNAPDSHQAGATKIKVQSPSKSDHVEAVGRSSTVSTSLADKKGAKLSSTSTSSNSYSNSNPLVKNERIHSTTSTKSEHTHQKHVPISKESSRPLSLIQRPTLSFLSKSKKSTSATSKKSSTSKNQPKSTNNHNTNNNNNNNNNAHNFNQSLPDFQSKVSQKANSTNISIPVPPKPSSGSTVEPQGSSAKQSVSLTTPRWRTSSSSPFFPTSDLGIRNSQASSAQRSFSLTSSSFVKSERKPKSNPELEKKRAAKKNSSVSGTGTGSGAKSETKSGRVFQPGRLYEAIRNGHIFEVRGPMNYTVRNFLQRRGWVEKPARSIEISSSSNVSNLAQGIVGKIPGLTASHHQQLKLQSQRKLDRPQWSVLARHPANLIWADSNERVLWKAAEDWQLVNKFPEDNWSLKKSLIRPIQHLHWFGVNCGIFPRSYRLYVDEEKTAFIQDYRLTACLSLLKMFVRCIEKEDAANKGHQNNANGNMRKDPKSLFTAESEMSADNSSILFHTLNYALLQAKRYILTRRHDDLDLDESGKDAKGGRGASSSSALTSDLDWELFLKQCYNITHSKSILEAVGKLRNTPQVRMKYMEVKTSLEELGPFWSQYHIDGTRNVWIFKPGDGLMGIGIQVMDKYDNISKKFLTADTRQSLWIVQKYLEKPFLVFGTKFDIRQWFLVTSWSPLTVFFYRKSYLRFSGQVFSLDDLHESIHLTNNAVQTRYRVDPKRDSALPSCNMWTSGQFQNYLKKIGQPTIWNDVIYPGMKNALIGTLLAARENVVDRPRSFQLMGADFILANDFRLYFIEINSSPDMRHTTPVTAKLCPQCICDALKVVLDWKGGTHPKANTGDFELIYRGQKESPMSHSIMKEGESKGYMIRGKKLPVTTATIQFIPDEQEMQEIPLNLNQPRNYPVSNIQTKTEIVQTSDETDA